MLKLPVRGSAESLGCISPFAFAPAKVADGIFDRMNRIDRIDRMFTHGIPGASPPNNHVHPQGNTSSSKAGVAMSGHSAHMATAHQNLS